MTTIGKFFVWSIFAIFAVNLIGSFAANTGEKSVEVRPLTDSDRESRCKWALKQNLKDPDSLQIIKTMHLPLENGGKRVLMKYRAKNSFGGFVVEEEFCDFAPEKK